MMVNDWKMGASDQLLCVCDIDAWIRRTIYQDEYSKWSVCTDTNDRNYYKKQQQQQKCIWNKVKMKNNKGHLEKKGVFCLLFHGFIICTGFSVFFYFIACIFSLLCG